MSAEQSATVARVISLAVMELIKSIEKVKQSWTCYFSTKTGPNLRNLTVTPISGLVKIYIQEESAGKSVFSTLSVKKVSSCLRLRKNDFRWKSFKISQSLSKVERESLPW